MPFPCQLLIDPPTAGAWNMAVDETLLEAAAGEGLATLRFYQWSEPTVSLGYFQKYAERAVHPESGSLNAVRRVSGGGALLHDRELTYSLCLPKTHPLVKAPEQLYRLVHQSLIEALAEQGVVAAPWGRANDAEDAFLCFQRRTADDLVMTGAEGNATPMKIAGSAQRRRRGAALQHGSLLLESSAFALELPGIYELSGQRLATERLVESWSTAVAAQLSLALQPATLGISGKEIAEKFLAERFANKSWTERS